MSKDVGQTAHVGSCSVTTAELAAELGLTPAETAKSIRELEYAGLVLTVPAGSTGPDGRVSGQSRFFLTFPKDEHGSAL